LRIALLDKCSHGQPQIMNYFVELRVVPADWACR